MRCAKIGKLINVLLGYQSKDGVVIAVMWCGKAWCVKKLRITLFWGELWSGVVSGGLVCFVFFFSVVGYLLQKQSLLMRIFLYVFWLIFRSYYLIKFSLLT